MRRSLVTTDETARHPFLASLPPHIRASAAVVEARPRIRLSRGDIQRFFLAYIGCFVAASIFIA